MILNPPGDRCRRCLEEIDRPALQARLAKSELPSIAERAAKSSKYCSPECASLDLLEARTG